MTYVPVKMAADEFVYCLLCKRMTILKLVQSSKLLHIEAVGQNHIWQPNTTAVETSGHILTNPLGFIG